MSVTEKQLKKLRWISFGILTLATVWVGVQFALNRSAVTRLSSLEQAWAEIEDQVNKLSQLEKDRTRYLQGYETLKGWSVSRYDWATLLNDIRKSIPDRSENMQFTRLEFDEQITGLRDQIPGENAIVYSSLVREASVLVHGAVKSDFPMKLLTTFKNNLSDLMDESSSFETSSLEIVTPQVDKWRKRTNLSYFEFLILLSPSEVRP